MNTRVEPFTEEEYVIAFNSLNPQRSSQEDVLRELKTIAFTVVNRTVWNDEDLVCLGLSRDDLISEVLYKLYSQYPTYCSQEGSLTNWAFAVGKREISRVIAQASPLSREKTRLAWKIEKASALLSSELGHEPTAFEMVIKLPETDSSLTSIKSKTQAAQYALSKNYPSQLSLEDFESKESSPEDVAIAHDEAARLAEAIALLKPKTRKMLCDRLFNNLTIKEVALKHGVSPGWVSRTVNNTISELQGLVGKTS